MCECVCECVCLWVCVSDVSGNIKYINAAHFKESKTGRRNRHGGRIVLVNEGHEEGITPSFRAFAQLLLPQEKLATDQPVHRTRGEIADFLACGALVTIQLVGPRVGEEAKHCVEATRG